MNHNITAEVLKVEHEPDRTLLYTDLGGKGRIKIPYYAIAGKTCNIAVGDTIEYEECGVNFGWFVRRVE